MASHLHTKFRPCCFWLCCSWLLPSLASANPCFARVAGSEICQRALGAIRSSAWAHSGLNETTKGTNRIVGSFLSLSKYPERALHIWAQRYGPLYSFTIGNQLFVVISDPSTAKDLLITKGSLFSDRKEMFVKSRTVLLGRGITSSRYGDQWYVNCIFERRGRGLAVC